MATFEEHVAQAENNLKFLTQVNQQIKNYFDWQITVCFYTALHLANAHLSTHNVQYRKHHDVNIALNPDVHISVSKIPETEYDAYLALQRLSRRSRYLANEKDLGSERAFYTYEKHLAKAIRHLDKIVAYFSDKYKLSISPVKFSCSELKASDSLKYFKL